MTRAQWNRTVSACLLTFTLVATNVIQARSQNADLKSVNGGVYTSDQAGRGERAFSEHCGKCHDGGEFTGEGFVDAWRGPLSGLFGVARSTMPQDNPGSLSPQVYADVVAYLLKKNGYPAGSETLAGRLEAMQAVLLERAVKP